MMVLRASFPQPTSALNTVDYSIIHILDKNIKNYILYCEVLNQYYHFLQ